MAMWGIFLFLMLFGIISYIFGANDRFYCTVYCQVGIALFIIAAIIVTLVQAKACLKHKNS